MPIPVHRPYVQLLANHIWNQFELRKLISGYEKSNQVEVGGEPTWLGYDGVSLKGRMTMFNPEVYLVFNHNPSGLIELRTELKVRRSKIKGEDELDVLSAFEAHQVYGFENRDRGDNTFAIVEKSWKRELNGAQLVEHHPEWMSWFEGELRNVVRGGKGFCKTRLALSLK